MAKKDKKQKKQYGMGPGQSMAMAGNTGLASFKEKDINRVQQEKRAYNEFSGRDRNERASYTDIGQEINELASKYRRPVKIADGFGAYSDGSGRAYTPNDFNADGSFRSFTATQPTASQVFGRGGDFRRAFTGYNSINYDNPGQGYSPVSMQRTPGMIEQGILSPLTTMAKAALSATNNLAGKVKPSGTIENFMKSTYPTMREPRGDGILGAYDKFTNLAKAMVGAENYKTITDETVKSYDDLVNQTDSSYKETSDEFNKTVEDMSDVEKEIFLNPKLKFARNDSAIRLALEQENDAKELKKIRDKIEAEKQQFNNRLKEIMQQDNAYSGILNTINPESSREGRELFQQDNAYSRIPPVSDLIDQTFPDNVLNTEETSQSAPGITSLVNNFDASNIVTEDDRTSSVEDLINNSKREISPFSFLNPFDNIPTGVALTEALSPDSLNLSDMGLILGDTTINDLTEQGKQFYDYYTGEDGGMSTEEALKNIKVLQSEPSNVSKYGDLISSNSITDYLNPGNLVDVGQDGTSGKTYGENKYAIFNTVDDGLRALTKDLNKKVGDFKGNVKKIISKYASGDPDVKGYVDFITDIVGPTVEENEIPTLIESIIIKENKPEIADQYLKYLRENSNKIYGGIISS